MLKEIIKLLMMCLIVKTLHLQRNYRKICCLGVNSLELPNTFIIFPVTIVVNNIFCLRFKQRNAKVVDRFFAYVFSCKKRIIW